MCVTFAYSERDGSLNPSKVKSGKKYYKGSIMTKEKAHVALYEKMAKSKSSMDKLDDSSYYNYYGSLISATAIFIPCAIITVNPLCVIAAYTPTWVFFSDKQFVVNHKYDKITNAKLDDLYLPKPVSTKYIK